ncbi:MAG: anti-sigma factor [Acidobacteria bacterium]|nr:anti-sigma factor [Acidobacteriota bacterium]
MTAHEQYGEDLALYALGLLEGNERGALEQHLATCSSCRRELEQLRGDMGLLALEAVGPAPPQRSRKRLLEAIAFGARPREVQTRTRWWTWAPVVASILLAVVGVALWRENSQQKRRIDALQTEISQSAATLEHAKMVIAMLESPDAVRVSLSPGQTSPQPHGKAMYLPHKGALIFMASNMPAAPPAKTYEVWLVPMSGAPLPAGTFKPDARGSATVMMPPLPAGIQAKAFAVTVENEGGSPTPTMPMVLVGAAS